jgi:four helix bundle protein
MTKIERFEDLVCWQESRKLVKQAFILSETGKFSKDFELKNQFKRAALSAMNNIAEGFARFNYKEFIRFLDFAQSSLAEVKSMLYLLEDLNYVDVNELKVFHQLVDRCKMLVLGLIKSINKRQKDKTLTS